MLRILNEEGYDIKERELMRVRSKNRWLLRVPSGMRAKKQNSDEDVISQLQQALYPDAQLADAEGEDEAMDNMSMLPPAPRTRAASPPLSPEVMAKRQERLVRLQKESAERWATRKRRRRTRGWAGLPADPPGPPRFPSETTIDESKAFLSLDARLYRDIRARFQRICEEAGIIKKTIAGPERWEAAKDSLIQESPHLQSVFWQSDENVEAKKLALDVICGDVTKRMRTLSRRMTIAEAKNALGVNPEESRLLRNSFYQVLKEDHFTSKLEAGEDHWKELKETWINDSDLLQNILAPGDADPQHQERVKAIEVLCRDVMKRLRDDQTKRDPTRKKKFDSNFSAGDEGDDMSSLPPPMAQFDNGNDANAFQTSSHNLVQAARGAQAQASQMQTSRPRNRAAQQQPQPQQIMMDHNLQIDPSLLLAASHDPSMMNRGIQSYPEPQYQQYAPQAPANFPVYFRLHPSSDIQTNTRMWVGTLNSGTVDELRQLATAKFPGTVAFRMEGIITQNNGHEMTLPVDQDDELQAYLAIGGAKPVFSVHLVHTWKGTQL